jgi:hypothetical protein
MAQNKIIKPGMKPPANQKPPRPAKMEGTASKTQSAHNANGRAVNHDHKKR